MEQEFSTQVFPSDRWRPTLRPYLSAPSSPGAGVRCASKFEFSDDDDDDEDGDGASVYDNNRHSNYSSRRSSLFFPGKAAVPFRWETSPGVPKGGGGTGTGSPAARGDDDEFEFLGGHRAVTAVTAAATATAAAEDLFCDGKIRPLNDHSNNNNNDSAGACPPPLPPPPAATKSSPATPRGGGGGAIGRAMWWAPRRVHNASRDFDPFEAALDEARKSPLAAPARSRRQRSVHRRARSLSPFSPRDRDGDEGEEMEPLRQSEVAVSNHGAGDGRSSTRCKWSVQLREIFLPANKKKKKKKERFRFGSWYSNWRHRGFGLAAAFRGRSAAAAAAKSLA